MPFAGGLGVMLNSLAVIVFDAATVEIQLA